jgi:Pyridoxamine 5'-phosphate oxidase
MSWRDLERAAPEIARLGKDRLDRTRVALLGTLRQDGSPRISPVEPYLWEGDLLFGTMAWSLKTGDLVRDPRCALHSAVTSPDSGDGELKLYGTAVAADDQLGNACKQAWWVKQSPNVASVFALCIQLATFISWDIECGEMTARRWSRERGYRETRRTYP